MNFSLIHNAIILTVMKLTCETSFWFLDHSQRIWYLQVTTSTSWLILFNPFKSRHQCIYLFLLCRHDLFNNNNNNQALVLNILRLAMNLSHNSKSRSHVLFYTILIILYKVIIFFKFLVKMSFFYYLY